MQLKIRRRGKYLGKREKTPLRKDMVKRSAGRRRRSGRLLKRVVTGGHVSDELLLRIGQHGPLAGDQAKLQPLLAVLNGDGDTLIQGILRGKALNPDGIKITHGNQVHQRRPPIYIDDAGGIVQIGLMVLCGNIIDKILILSYIAHKPVVPQILQRDGNIPVQQFMVFGDYNVRRHGDKRRQLQPFFGNKLVKALRLMACKVNAPYIANAFLHIRHHIQRGPLVQKISKLRKPLAAGAYLVKAFHRMGIFRHGEPHAVPLRLCPAGDLLEALHLLENDLRVLQKGLSLGRKRDALLGPLKQGHPRVRLHVPNDVAEMRLGNV
ncbi:hypothetical protein SDC9_70266 [bioreactor metagenome]|uniref:Uncharacterized protein n=1 Tax=bioreactor metagenome TaxID=1076179 RepID=A0A644Y5G7_9ZZZZ